jgi:hypothetical protein
MILVKINHPYLRVGHHNYNTSRTVIFLKTAVRIRLDAYIRIIVVLTGGKLT